MKDWVEICPGIAVKEWRHQSADPKTKARRHIVVRKQISRRSQAGGKLLFDDLPDYRFSLYVTNLDLPLDQIWYIYNTPGRLREQDQRVAARLRPRRVLPAGVDSVAASRLPRPAGCTACSLSRCPPGSSALGHGGLVPLHHGSL
ncbi:MAG: hypothetical protein IPK32_05555 [Verrucomicrobiaceae bacterium]|nr:hypothetical protein [Verrucomicrobiaceae bacterium]